jgi:hypothetical protein
MFSKLCNFNKAVRFYCLACIVTTGTMSIFSHAHAGPWTKPQGKGQIILTHLESRADGLYNASGDVVADNDFHKRLSSLYLEYGLRDKLTVLGTLGLRHVDSSNTASSNGYGLDEAAFGARYEIFRKAGLVFSTEILAGATSDEAMQNMTSLQDIDGTIENRILAGFSTTLLQRGIFFQAGLGHSFRTGRNQKQIIADFGAGIHVTEELMFMAQSFHEWDYGTTLNRSYQNHKAKLNVVYAFTEKLSAHIGILTSISGKNTPRERGVIAGLWYSF